MYKVVIGREDRRRSTLVFVAPRHLEPAAGLLITSFKKATKRPQGFLTTDAPLGLEVTNLL